MTYFTPETVSLLEVWASEVATNQGIRIVILPDNNPANEGNISCIYAPTTKEENVTLSVTELADTLNYDLHFSKKFDEFMTIELITQLANIFEENHLK